MKSFLSIILSCFFLSPAFPQVFNQQPVSTTASLHGTASFSATASADDPISYQWKRNASLSLTDNTAAAIAYNALLNMSASLSIEAWIYPTSANWMTVMMRGAYGYGLALTGSGSCSGDVPYKLVYWDQNGCGLTIRSGLSYSLNTWQHIAVTVEDIGSQLRIYFYLNGTPDGPYYSPQPAISNGGAHQALYIGRQGATCNCNFFVGKLNNMRLWNRLLSASEIAANRSNGLNAGTESGLIGNWKMDQTSGTTIADNTAITPAYLTGAGYSWTADNVPGANTTTLSFEDVSENDFGDYFLTATSGSASANSNIIYLNNLAALTLPVMLNSFEVKKEKQKVRLTWETEQEINADRFEVQHSTDALHFITVSPIPAKGGAGSRSAYSYLHATPATGMNYYRLKQVDRDGGVTYFMTRSVHFQTAGTEHIDLFATGKSSALLKLNGFEAGNYGLSLYGMSGRRIWNREMIIAPGMGIEAVTLPVSVSPGIYVMRLYGKHKNYTQKLKL